MGHPVAADAGVAHAIAQATEPRQGRSVLWAGGGTMSRWYRGNEYLAEVTSDRSFLFKSFP